MSEPIWLVSARNDIGLSEVRGSKHNPAILRYWTAIRAPFTDDETPWCAAFVGAKLEQNGIKSTRSAAARSYANYGTNLKKPILGCIVVFSRTGGGHVGFFVGWTKDGRILILGGNQGDTVKIAAFPTSRIIAYRWPPGQPLTSSKGSVSEDDVQTSTRESFADLPEDEATDRPSFLERAKSWLVGTPVFGALSSLYDWRVAAVVVVAALIVFLVLLYTKRI